MRERNRSKVDKLEAYLRHYKAVDHGAAYTKMGITDLPRKIHYLREKNQWDIVFEKGKFRLTTILGS